MKTIRYADNNKYHFFAAVFAVFASLIFNGNLKYSLFIKYDCFVNAKKAIGVTTQRPLEDYNVTLVYS